MHVRLVDFFFFKKRCLSSRRPGLNNLPEPKSWGRGVQRGNSFIILGGSASGNASPPFDEKIIMFDPDTEEWVELEETLEDSDLVDVALFAPPDFVADCE